MKNLNIALRSLFKKGRSNGIKILSLIPQHILLEINLKY